MIYALLGLSILLSFFVAMMTYYSNAHTFYKLVSLPTAIVTLILSVLLFLDLRGKPLEEYPDDFKLVHMVNVQDEEGMLWTLFWAYTKKDGHRLYKIPYDREIQKKMNQLKEQQEGGGVPVTGDFEKNEEGRPELQIEHEKGELFNENEVKNYTPEGEPTTRP